MHDAVEAAGFTQTRNGAGAPSLASAVFPLGEFYRRAGVALPAFELVGGADLPDPWRSLLVHDRDMTPTLEEHHRDEIHIDVLGRERHGNAYYREVILRLNADRRAVEFGANRVALELLPAEARRWVLQERIPFGSIMREFAVPHAGHPDAFFRVQADSLMTRALGLTGTPLLYGRHNTLRDPEGRAISEVVEILPP